MDRGTKSRKGKRYENRNDVANSSQNGYLLIILSSSFSSTLPRLSGTLGAFETIKNHLALRSTEITMKTRIIATTLMMTMIIYSLLITVIKQEAFTQNTTATSSSLSTATNQSAKDTFNAHGTISGIAADTMIGSNETLGSHSADLFVLGGNWSLGVKGGNLTDFETDIVMMKFDGTQRHLHRIENMTNATGAVPPVTNENITLVSKNYTAFMGIVDIGQWKNVSFTGNLNNGNILILNVDPIKTEHHFKGLPIYGIVTSLTDRQQNQTNQTNMTSMQQQQNQTQQNQTNQTNMTSMQQQQNQTQTAQQNQPEGGQDPLSQLGEMLGNMFGQ